MINDSNTGGEVELLLLPAAYLAREFVHDTPVYGANQMQSYARANVDRALAESRAELQKLRGMLIDWHEQTSDKGRRIREEAPGHSHEVLGVWDSDNGTYAGAECAQCALWFEAARLRSAMEPNP